MPTLRQILFVLGLAAIAAASSGCKSKPSKPARLGPEPPAQPLTALEVRSVNADLSVPDPRAAYWKKASRGEITLLAQPMVTPRPETTTTDKLIVAAVHNRTHIAFRLSWADPEKSEAGRLGQFSDAAAIEFPVNDLGATPPMMGGPNQPVHIFHWRAQYQRDKEKGKPQVKDIYPNVSVDMYPMEFKEAPGGTPEQREKFSPGVAEGNPQSYTKEAVDEIIAEGFSTSAVQAGHGSVAHGEWRAGEWTVVIVRPLSIEGGSSLKSGGGANIGLAVWQGGKGEVGARKCVTMQWTPVVIM